MVSAEQRPRQQAEPGNVAFAAGDAGVAGKRARTLRGGARLSCCAEVRQVCKGWGVGKRVRPLKRTRHIPYAEGDAVCPAR